MKRLFCTCLLYALLTAISLFVHRCIVADLMSFNFMNGISFSIGFVCVLFALVFIKTSVVLFLIGRHCDERGELRRFGSWCWVMHHLFWSRLKVVFPFSLSRIDYAKIDAAFCKTAIGVEEGVDRRRGDRMLLIPDLPVLDEDSSLLLMASTFRNFAEMALIGLTCVVMGSASNCCMMEDCAFVGTFLLGSVQAVVSYAVLRLALVFLKASNDVVVGRYTCPRVILYFTSLFFPLGTIFAIRSLRILRSKEVNHRMQDLNI